LKTFAETAAEIAREAGARVQELARQRIGFELKGAYDLVTEADRASSSNASASISLHTPC
jgi:fructose-1,6-bisphosphatase/inositol monophosphatase family enzyme